jgi:23S rRNA pseudouridine2605 synthase
MISNARNGREQVSLTRAISKLGIASRSEAEVMIRDGRVAVNGQPVHSSHLWVDLRVDRISIDGKPARSASPVYFVMHKPSGVVTTQRDERGRRTVHDLLPPGMPRVFAVGRLDKETSGLLLFTNDVRFGDAMTDPLQHVPKEYRVTLDQPPRREDLELWRTGMMLEDGTQLLPARVKTVHEGSAGIVLTIVEGKNRQVRRMVEERGYRVVSLERTGIGSLRLGAMNVGDVRPLTFNEKQDLLALRKDPSPRKGRSS